VSSAHHEQHEANGDHRAAGRYVEHGDEVVCPGLHQNVATLTTTILRSRILTGSRYSVRSFTDLSTILTRAWLWPSRIDFMSISKNSSWSVASVSFCSPR